MNTKARMMGLAALPLAGLLAGGGVALAQTAGTPAGTQAVQQAVTHRNGSPHPDHAMKTTAQQTRDQQRLRERDGSCDHQARTAQTVNRTMQHARDGSCVQDDGG